MELPSMNDLTPSLNFRMTIDAARMVVSGQFGQKRVTHCRAQFWVLLDTSRSCRVAYASLGAVLGLAGHYPRRLLFPTIFGLSFGS